MPEFEAAANSNQDAKGKFVPGNKAWANPRSAKSALAALEESEDAAASEAARWGHAQAARRLKELEELHGPVSSGVRRTLEAAARSWAGSRLWSAKATSAGNPELEALGHRLALGAAKLEESAVKLAESEATARKRRAPLDLMGGRS